MTEPKRTITRRDFLRGTTFTTLALAMGLFPEEEKIVGPAPKTKIVLIRDPDVMDAKGRINAKVIRRMLDDAVSALFDKEDPVEAWKLLVKPKDVVGIKSNVWTPLPTPEELEQAIKKRVMDAGVPEENVDITDRGVLESKVFQKATALINARPLRTHAWSGVGGCIKNYIMFVPRPSKYHGNSCEDLGAIWKLPMVKDKTRLNVLVMLQPLFYGVGPHHFDSTYTWQYKGLLVGTDPVALDAVGVRIFQAKRLAHFGKERPFKPPAHHIAFADIKHKIGTSDVRTIEIVKLGWKEGVLI
ncbi:MAG: DUF362 domain-containing protein [Candidatus Zixiibacteriota bacterium]|nr:MAG: DUF362 domain-containing protein [candidate division Zixibacteria bacterium]